jgi:hypothetical protein
VVGKSSVLAQGIGTAELRLGRAIGFVDVPAQLAFARGVAGINKDNSDAGQLCLVLNEGAELEEAPVGVPRPPLSLNRCPAPYAAQVLQGDATSGAFGFLHGLLGDDVVGVALVAGLPPSQAAELAPRTQGTLVCSRASCWAASGANLTKSVCFIHPG